MNALVHNDILVSELSVTIVAGGAALQDVPGLLKKIIREDAWRERVIQRTGEVARFDRFSDFVATPPLEGLGADVRMLERLCYDDREALDLLDEATRQRQGGDQSETNIIKDAAPEGTSRRQALRKLRKDRPDLHERVIAGEVSPHAAMVEAGFRPRTFTVPADPEGIARVLLRRLAPDEVRAVAECLAAAMSG